MDIRGLGVLILGGRDYRELKPTFVFEKPRGPSRGLLVSALCHGPMFLQGNKGT